MEAITNGNFVYMGKLFVTSFKLAPQSAKFARELGYGEGRVIVENPRRVRDWICLNLSRYKQVLRARVLLEDIR